MLPSSSILPFKQKQLNKIEILFLDKSSMLLFTPINYNNAIKQLWRRVSRIFSSWAEYFKQVFYTPGELNLGAFKVKNSLHTQHKFPI